MQRPGSRPNRSGLLTLLGPEGVVEESVPLAQEECLTLDTFADLIDLYDTNGRQLIIARAKTFNKVDVGRFLYSYYSAFQLNKVLFRKRGSEILSRYHKHHPVIQLNPLTNEEIVGEVVYFQVQSSSKSTRPTRVDETNPDDTTSCRDQMQIAPLNTPISEFSPPTESRSLREVPHPSLVLLEESKPRINRIVVRSDDTYTESDVTAFVNNREIMTPPNIQDVHSQVGQERGIQELSPNRVAKYIGTDYHFVHSEAFRKVFIENGLDGDNDLLASPLNAGSTRFTGAHIDEPEIEALANRIRTTYGRQRRGRLFYVPYNRSVVYGIVISVYFAFCSAVLATSVLCLRDSPTTDTSSIWIWSFLPFIVFIVDRFTTSIAESNEPRKCVLFKLIIAGIHIFLPDFAYQSHNGSYYLSRNILNAVVPCVALVYSRWLYAKCTRGKIMI